MLLTAILLTSLTISSDPSNCYIDQGFGKSPQNEAWKVLPPPTLHDDQFLFERETFLDMTHRLQCYDEWPQACQIVLNQQDKAHKAIKAALVDRNNELQEVIAEQKPTDWKKWHIVLIGVGAGVLGGLAGFGVGKLVR